MPAAGFAYARLLKSGLKEGHRDFSRVSVVTYKARSRFSSERNQGGTIAADANVILTGDRDLLVLQEYEGIAIVTAREFLDRYFPEN
ncbi:MAG: hypothetical protein RLZZ338_3206 [Cyanobacteriota bacterium]|jgi:hypothetical protein